MSNVGMKKHNKGLCSDAMTNEPPSDNQAESSSSSPSPSPASPISHHLISQHLQKIVGCSLSGNFSNKINDEENLNLVSSFRIQMSVVKGGIIFRLTKGSQIYNLKRMHLAAATSSAF